ncbi:helicase-related protein, partial [Klebsiella aerogenes]|uniref:helicase-related protein n=1 Tax=Klebsiella aerogenes TaxID=548 RepID=UPI001952D0E0
MVNGDMNGRSRQATVDQFQAGQFDCYLATYESSYQGYTLTRASKVLHVETHGIADRVKQAEDRA